MAAHMAVPPFVIRTAKTTDATAIGALLRTCYTDGLKADYHPNVLAAALPIITQPKESLIRSGTYFVGDSGESHLVASGGWSWHGPVGGVAPRDTAHLRHVVVSLDYMRRGIGRVLLDHIFASARAQGVRRLICTSTITAAGFYEAMGFECRGDVALTLGPGLGFPAVQLVYDL
ncbi:GNAT family N-acetyltransferase [Celeribacter marinus]|uniref:GNAT family N-acetyltransferase n=1 Tax=Celeribacter marinus TaxID=1397108 RepID=UPI0031739901